MHTIEYSIILFYLLCFILKCPLLIRYSIIKKISSIKIIKFLYKIGLFMNWNMFCNSPARHHKVKFIIELKNGEIFIYYLDTEKTDSSITKIIPELNLKPKCLAGLIHNYYNHGFFLIDYIEQVIKHKFGDNLKHFASYLQILRPDKNNPLEMYTGTYYPIIEKSYVDN